MSLFNHSKRPALLLATLTSGLLLTACSGQVQKPETVAVEQKPAETVEPDYRPIELQTLYSLLVADIAGQRNRMDITLRNYLSQTMATKDPGVARHTTMLAEVLRAESIAQKASAVWAEAAPDDAGAIYSAAVHQARAGQLESALKNMRRSLDAGGNSNFSLIARVSTKTPRASQQQLLATLLELREQYPENEDLMLAVANIQRNLEQRGDALQSVRALLGSNPDHPTALNLEARLLQELDRHEEAFTNYKAALERDPNNKRLRLQYARLLAVSDLGAAERQFEQLVENHPDDRELQFTLGLVYRENQKPAKAEALLETLSNEDPENDGVRFYLGLIKEDQGNSNDAISLFKDVKPGKVFGQAQARYADLMSKAGRLDEAIAQLQTLRSAYPSQYSTLTLISADTLTRSGRLKESHALLSDALEQHPEDKDLLYTRSMVNEKRQDLEGMEKDLRTMLSIDPDNAAALNALGYTLTVHTDRLDEAYALIKRAIALQPDDPAIMDSMGWIEYRRGNLNEALQYLEQAYAAFPDPEVAAHYGEVLWKTGKKEEARKIWRAALDERPDSSIMLDIVKRFGQP
jgi:tetratricopeptide (TPR) repeat protein